MKNPPFGVRLVILALFWVVSALSLHAGATDPVDAKVGFYEIPGFQSLSSDGERSGYGYDFLQLVRRHVMMNFSYTGYGKTWAESMQMLRDGEVDLLTGALYTPERAKQFDYSYPIGTTDINIYVRTDELRYRPRDYATYQGMRIGTVRSELLDGRIHRMAARCRFDCTLVEFEDFQGMFAALERGEIDALCVIATRLVTGFRILDSFDHETIHVIVRKGDRQLLDSLNTAILRIDQSVQMWWQKLYQANYNVAQVAAIQFSEAEKAFIRRHSTPKTAVVVATDNDWRPYSWREDGQYHGIAVEMLDQLMGMAGLKYRFADGDFSDERALKTRPDVSLYIGFVSKSQYAEEQRLIASPPCMHLSVAVVSLKRFDHIRVMGLSDNTPMLNAMVREKFGYEFRSYPNTEQMLAALRRGEVDGAMLYDYAAQIIVNSEEDTKLQITFIPGMTLPLFFVSRMEDERELITIMSKCIDHLGENERSKITTKYLTLAEKQMTLREYLRRNPWLALVVVLIILASISLVLYEKYKQAKVLQQKDAEARRLAEDANRAKTSFLFNMSHDIRTPMNAIIGFRDLLEKNQDDPERRANYLRKIEDASLVLLSIINNVLEMARIEKGAIELNESAWSAEQFSDIIFSIMGDMMSKKGLRFERSLNVRHNYIYCDPIKLREIFINILSNAYKYTPQGEVVMRVDELPCDREGWALYRTTISDTGMGMSEEFLPHLFEEFSRENNTTQGKIEGTGLGMPIVKRLVELMGGTIEVQSRKGEGTTFTITIMHRIADRSCLTETEGVALDADLFRGKRILLAEDNDLNAEIAQEILGEQGLLIERAEDGRICCDMLSAAPAGYYDLILMDIQMPGMNGYEATRAIRCMEDDEKANIPILAMTANAFEEDRRDALRAGMNGHLSKPIDLHDLMKTLASTIGRK